MTDMTQQQINGKMERRSTDDMSDRELLVELVEHMRAVADVVEDLADSPMVRALQGGGNPLLAMLPGMGGR